MNRFYKSTIVWVAIIFLLSSIFRVFFLDLIEFKSDEATTVYQTVLFFNHPYLASRGLISGTGAYNFPLLNYLMIMFGVISQDPQFLSCAIALMNSFLVCIFFLMVKKYYGFITAILASLLLAFSPWGVIFSRKIWAQDLINLLFIPFFWLLHEFILRKNNKVVLPMFILLALLIQLHGSGIFLFLTTILVLVVSKIRFSVKKATAGFLIGLIPALPYLIFQVTAYPLCPDCEALLKYQQAFRVFDLNNFVRPFQVIGGLGYHFVLGNDYADFIAVSPLVDILKYIFASGFLITAIGILAIVFKKRKYLFLVIYFLFVPILYFITKTPAYMHYFVIIIPITSLIFAISVTTAYDFISNKLFKIMILGYFLLFIVSNILFLCFFYRFIGFKKQINGDYGPIYSLTKSFIDKETSNYNNLSYYQQLKSYAYIYAQSDNLHTKLGEFVLKNE